MKKNTLFLCFVSALFLFVSCSKSVVFDEKTTFPDANWAFENKAITFDVPFIASEIPYTIVLELSVLGTPNVDKFLTTFSIFTPKGSRTVKSLYFNFVNPHEPCRKGNSPNEKIYKLTVYPKKYFTETGTYSFEVNQFSNKADNYGIRSLRMYIEKVKK